MTFLSIDKTVFLLLMCALLICLQVSAVSLSPESSFTAAPTIANGDPVYIRGIATGHPRDGLQVWLIGYNYVRITTVSTNADNTYEYELKPADTLTLAPGQYFVLIQHPMMNGQFDIYYDAASGRVINRQLGTGTSIFQLTGAGSLQSTNGANALMHAINSQNIDDTFATTSFIVSPPTAFINPIGDHAVGDQFTITGSTNLAAGDNLMVEITSSSFQPAQKGEGAEFPGSAGTVRVQAGTGGLNRWSFPVNTSTFKPDEYIVKVTGITVDVTGSTMFTIIEKLPTTVPTFAPITTKQHLTQSLASPPAPQPTTQKSPFPVFAAMEAVTLAAGVLILARKKILPA